MAGGRVRISPEGLSDAVVDALKEAKELTEDAVQASIDKTAKEVVAKTKGAAPMKTGKYKRGWSSKTTKKNGRGAYGRTVYNRTKYGLAHLLQHGHGGPRPARAIPHIVTDEETETIFEKNLEREMYKG